MTRFTRCPAVVRLLVRRGIASQQDVQAFFSPSLSQLHDPFLMQDMDRAVERLNSALGGKEKIMIYGDYDVDGTTAVALVYRYLRQFYSNLVYYIPTRDDEGYGISIQSIDYAKSIGVSLIIVLDCGIKAIDEIAYAKSLGIDFIVCDHHVPDDELPPAVAILNPKLPTDRYPFKGLSGCGVGFKFMQAFAISNNFVSHYELNNLLDLVAVSIVADIVPLTDENRVMCYYGLKRLNTSPNIGLRSIIKLCNLGKKELTKSKLLGWLLKKLHMIVVDRHHSDMEAMRTFMKTLRNGEILALFPEGTRHHKGIMEEMESGIGLIALRSNVPVYPVYIDRRVLPFRVTHCWVGDPIPYDDIRADGVNSETSARFMARITETYRQMMADAARR